MGLCNTLTIMLKDKFIHCLQENWSSYWQFAERQNCCRCTFWPWPTIHSWSTFTIHRQRCPKIKYGVSSFLFPPSLCPSLPPSLHPSLLSISPSTSPCAAIYNQLYHAADDRELTPPEHPEFYQSCAAGRLYCTCNRASTLALMSSI